VIRRRPIPKTRSYPEFSQHYETILAGCAIQRRAEDFLPDYLRGQKRGNFVNFHFARKLVALIALYGVLGLSVVQPAAARKPPQPQCPPTCGHGQYGWDQYMITSAVNHVTINNTVYRRTNPTTNQITAAAEAMEAWAQARINDGTMPIVQTKFLNMLQAFYANPLNGNQVAAVSAQFGNAVPASVFTAQMQKVTQAERQQIVAFVQTYGLKGLVDFWAQAMTQFAGQWGRADPRHPARLIAANYHLRRVNDFGHISEGQAKAIFDGVAAIGAIMLFTPGLEGFGLIFTLGGLAGDAYLDWND